MGKGRRVEGSPGSVPLYGPCSGPELMWLAIRYGGREQGIGRVRVGLLRHADALARRRLVAALTARGHAVGLLTIRGWLPG